VFLHREDGKLVQIVTGVHTCALPILLLLPGQLCFENAAEIEFAEVLQNCDRPEIRPEPLVEVCQQTLVTEIRPGLVLIRIYGTQQIHARAPLSLLGSPGQWLEILALQILDQCPSFCLLRHLRQRLALQHQGANPLLLLGHKSTVLTIPLGDGLLTHQCLQGRTEQVLVERNRGANHVASVARTAADLGNREPVVLAQCWRADKAGAATIGQLIAPLMASARDSIRISLRQQAGIDLLRWQQVADLRSVQLQSF